MKKQHKKQDNRKFKKRTFTRSRSKNKRPRNPEIKKWLKLSEADRQQLLNARQKNFLKRRYSNYASCPPIGTLPLHYSDWDPEMEMIKYYKRSA